MGIYLNQKTIEAIEKGRTKTPATDKQSLDSEQTQRIRFGKPRVYSEEIRRHWDDTELVLAYGKAWGYVKELRELERQIRAQGISLKRNRKREDLIQAIQSYPDAAERLGLQKVDRPTAETVKPAQAGRPRNDEVRQEVERLASQGLSRQQIAKQVYLDEYKKSPTPDNLRVLVDRLRKYLPSSPSGKKRK